MCFSAFRLDLRADPIAALRQGHFGSVDARCRCPFMILVSVGFNEWGHTFWFREEFFAAPISLGIRHRRLVCLGVGGILLQQVERLTELLNKN